MAMQESKTSMLFQNISDALLQKLEANPSEMKGRDSHYEDAEKTLRKMSETLAPFDFSNMQTVTADAWMSLAELGFKRCDENPRSLSYTQEFWALVIILATETERAQFHIVFVKHLFSNYVQDPFNVEVKKGDKVYNILVPCVEAGFQAEKANQAADEGAFEAIYYSAEPKICKELGNKLPGLDTQEWDRESPKFMTKLFMFKLKQSVGTRTIIDCLMQMAAILRVKEESIYIHEGADFDGKWGTKLNIMQTTEALVHSSEMELYPVLTPYSGMNRFGMCMNQAIKSSGFKMPVVYQPEQFNQTEQLTKKARLSPTEERAPSSPVEQTIARMESSPVRTMSSPVPVERTPSTPVVDCPATIPVANTDVPIADADADVATAVSNSAE